MCPAEALASESPDSAASDAGAAGEPANEKDAFDMATRSGGDEAINRGCRARKLHNYG